MNLLRIIFSIWVIVLTLPSISLASSKLPILYDVTQKSGISFRHSFGDGELSNIVESAGVGVALVDYDNDGLLDIYFVNGSYNKNVNHPKGRKLKGKLRNRLYRNKGDWNFEDVTDQSGIGDTGYGMAALFGDLDNDGDQDLYVTNYGNNKLFQNNGNGTFTDITDKAGVGCKLWSLGVTYLDFNHDGFLDIYVGNYLKYDPEYSNFYPGDAFPGPLAYSGQPDILYRNNGDMTFTDVTQKAGILNTQGRAMGISAADIDNDGLVDIFVANDAMENFLYRNNGNSTFTNIALISGTGFGQNGEATSAMSPEFGDLDNDGDVDILVPDMDYSSLYINTGKGFFADESSVSGLASACGQYTSWSGNIFDFNGDSLLDIFITNGDPHFYEPEEDLLLLNMGNNKIKDISPRVGEHFQQKRMGRGSAIGDLDNDGDLDIVITNLGDTPIIYRNDSQVGNNWLQIELSSKHANRDAFGTRVRVYSGSGTQQREVLSSSGYLSQSDSRLHFSLGASPSADKIEIIWPGGRKDVYTDIRANQSIKLQESW